VRLGTLAQYPSKTAAWRAAEPILRQLNEPIERRKTMGDLLDRYIYERIPQRHSTNRGYTSLIHAHIRPKWGNVPLERIHSYEVEVWLLEKDCGDRRKGHIHGLMKVLFRYAMHIRWMVTQANPMKNFSLPGATKRSHMPGVISQYQFHELLERIPQEPYRTMVIGAMCLGVRVSELLALQWQDFDFLEGKVKIRRAIVEGHVGAVKTYHSEKELPLHPILAAKFAGWLTESKFKEPENYVFASPWKAGELPYNASKIQSKFLREAGHQIGLPFTLGWHTFRHSHRVQLRTSGAPIDVQRDLMRHADIQTTLQIYGGTDVEELRPFNAKVVDRLFGREQ
jgi:integrase